VGSALADEGCFMTLGMNTANAHRLRPRTASTAAGAAGRSCGGRCLTSRYPQALGKWQEFGLCETMLGKSFHPLTSMNNLAGVLVLSQVRGFPRYTTSNTTMAINFFGFPTEIRLKIYSELLVHSKPIVFVADYGPSSPPLFRSKRDGLYPALLRVNKRAHSEASPLLYSNNRFRFPDIFTSTPSATDSAHIAPFLSQIGSQASLIRHICIAFPTFDDYRRGRARLHEAHLKNLART
jgi:hypothetical protein